MLHTGILPHHTSWAQFFHNLRYVVIDEMHIYRGVFGSHVANVIRRLKRVAQFYGSYPQFVLTSATIANPVSGAAVDRGAGRGDRRGRFTAKLWHFPSITLRLCSSDGCSPFTGRSVRPHGSAGIRRADADLRPSRRTTELALKYLREKTVTQPTAARLPQRLPSKKGEN